MEFLAAAAVIVVVCLIAGVSKTLIYFAAGALAVLILAAMALFFVYFFTRLCLSKRRKAQFSHIDKSPFYRYRSAFYIIDEKTYPNVFPSEGIIEKKLYKEGKTYKIRLDRWEKFVFDRFAMLTCTFGLLFSIGLAAAGAYILFYLI